MNELTSELQELFHTAIAEEKYAAADFLSKIVTARKEHPVFGDIDVREDDPDLLEWQRQSQWPQWRKTIARFLGVYVGP